MKKISEVAYVFKNFYRDDAYTASIPLTPTCVFDKIYPTHDHIAVLNMTALQEAIKNHLFSKKNCLANILPGIIVGIVALPLAMAFAIASGVSPEKGLYTAIVAGFCVSVFGGTRVQIAGPTGAFVILLGRIVQQHGFEGLQLATFMAGVFLLLMGLLKLGSMIKYIPEPVIVGFTSGIALTIFVGQWKDFFGFSEPLIGTNVCEKIINTLRTLPKPDPATAMLACLSLGIIIFVNRRLKPIPGFLVALIAATILQSVFQFSTVATIGSAFGGIPQTLPSFRFPTCSWHLITELIGPAFTVALLGAIESLLSAAVADSMTGTHHRSNQELIGQGIANLFTPMFGGFAATGAIARTATNIKSGGNCPLAGIVHCITLVLFILFLAPLASAIPIAALSAVLFVVSYNMSDGKRFWRLLTTAPNSDRFVLLITFLLTILVDLVVAVNIGVVFSTLFFMRRMAKTVQIEHDTDEMLRYEHLHVDVPKNVGIYSIEGPFFFGAITTFQSALSVVNSDVKAIIIRLRHVPFVDVTAIDTLKTFTIESERNGIHVVFCEANSLVRARLSRAHFIDFARTDHFERSLEEAIAVAEQKAASIVRTE